ncbi:MAG: NAD-dependent epimerase/dehydratase family protein [Chloroflexota bacterium]|nr:NAD-dependent epimerase/dehydratase family protein [Chloroflexota bacterium]
MNVLITGGAGYIGSDLLHVLAGTDGLQLGRVRVLDNMQEEKYQALMNLPEGVEYDFVLGDIRNEEDVRRAIGDDTNTVIHLAALTNATLSFERQEATELTNHVGTQNIVRAVQDTPSVNRLIYASTTSVYGPTSGIVTEESECKPASPYGVFKLKGEQDVLALPKVTNGRVKSTALRFATVYGYSAGLRVHTVVNIFAFRAAVGIPLEVFGSGEQKRPYIHVRDVARALAFCLKEPRTEDGLFNVVGQNGSVNDILALIEPRFPKLKVVHTNREILNQISYEVDGSKLYSLGYSPELTLEDGINEFARLYGAFTRQPIAVA